MSGFLLRMVLNGLLLFALLAYLPGLFVDTLGGMMLGAALLGLANALVRPVLRRGGRGLGRASAGFATLIVNGLALPAVFCGLPGFFMLHGAAGAAILLLQTLWSWLLTRTIEDR